MTTSTIESSYLTVHLGACLFIQRIWRGIKGYTQCLVNIAYTVINFKYAHTFFFSFLAAFRSSLGSDCCFVSFVGVLVFLGLKQNRKLVFRRVNYLCQFSLLLITKRLRFWQMHYSSYGYNTWSKLTNWYKMQSN